ncbi:glycerate kinase type-2 family protein [Halobaculum sp. EA56]|uniref:glycerate kinase type-2 family protein n=1 Tax=Halobaculum sp. EA56 TaxID=3421648 RepID=UPI003EBB89A0
MANEEGPPIAVERDGCGGDPAGGDADGPAVGTALACLRAGVAAALPETVVAEGVALDGDVLRVGDGRYDLREYDEVLVVGGGKATEGVAAALESLLGDRIDAGAVVTPESTGKTDADGDGNGSGGDRRVERIRGGHPVPTAGSVAGGDRVLELAERADGNTLVLAAITGGGSALLSAPADGVDLDDLRTTTDALLEAGADIGEINAVRKHLSRVKGGGLARAAAPARVVGIVLSDVVGDDLGVIASGPTAPDDTTFGDALGVLDRYGLGDAVPAAVHDRLEHGASGEVPETPASDADAFARVDNRVLADGLTAVRAAADAATERGYGTLVLSSRLRGEAADCGVTHAAVAEEVVASGHPVEPPAVVLSGGETTVTVAGAGDGGPNLECALAAAVEFAAPRSPLAGRECALLAADTDGLDGSTAYAGAVVTPDTVTDAGAARGTLADNDALGFLEGTGALVRTGPTGTNVNDLRVLVVEE